MTDKLHINMLGPLQVKVGETSADFRTDALRVLLAYLAAHQGTPQRRDSLAGLLSPDRPNKEALTYLRNRLTRLRQSINDDSTDPPWFDIDRKQIALRTGDDIVVDVTTFEQHLSAVEKHPHRELAGCPTCLGHLQAAVELVRGEFLAGLNFPSETWESWLIAQREHVQQRSIEAMGQLRMARTTLAEWESVIEIAQQQLMLEPWLEEAHRDIMQAHYHLGDRNAALAQYETCTARLWEELGVDPEDETIALHQQIVEMALETPEQAQPADNLPLQTGPFVGRQAEQTLLLKRLVDPNYRLMTLIGPGGIGKTRLSLEVGQQAKTSFPDGVWFVPLDAVKGGEEQIKIAVGEALGLGQEGKQLSGDQVIAILREKQLLLLFDNSEVKLEELAFIPEWLRRAPQIAILATSREPLNFEAESTVTLAGLPTGGGSNEGSIEGKDAGLSAAETLFGERGKMARDDFKVTAENQPLVRQICELVDGSPLGISLAAAWVRRRSLAQIIESINRSLDFLSTRLRDIGPRHRSMRAVLETSWEMLTANEQAVLAALSVFPSTFGADAAEQITGGSFFDFDGLCEKSLLQQQQEMERYGMHSLVRQFAAEKLAERTPAVERAFVDYYYAYAEKNREDHTELQDEWLNLQSMAKRIFKLEEWGQLLDLTDMMHESWFRFGRFFDANEIYPLAELAAQKLNSKERLTTTLIRWSEVGLEQSQYNAIGKRLDKALPIAYKLKNKSVVAQVKFLQGNILFDRGEYGAAQKAVEESIKLFEEQQDLLSQAKSKDLLGWTYYETDDNNRRSEIAAIEAINLFDQLVEQSSEKASSFRLLAVIAIDATKYLTAEEYAQKALKLAQDSASSGEEVASIYTLVAIYRELEKYNKAKEIGLRGLMTARQIGLIRWEGLILQELSAVSLLLGETDLSKQYTETILKIYKQIEDRLSYGYALRQMGDIYKQMGELKTSKKYWDDAREIAEFLNHSKLLSQLKERMNYD